MRPSYSVPDTTKAASEPCLVQAGFGHGSRRERLFELLAFRPFLIDQGIARGFCLLIGLLHMSFEILDPVRKSWLH